MFTAREKAACVLWLADHKSMIMVQRRFRREFNKDPPHENNIRRWYKQFQETGSVQKRKTTGRHRTSEEDVERIRVSCVRSPKKSVPRRSLQLNLPKSTVYDVMRKRLKLHAYKIQLLHAIKPQDRERRSEFAVNMLQRMDDEGPFLERIVFSDEATFHLNGCVNRHNCRIWGSEHPRVIHEHVRNSPKVNVWCGLMHNQILGPFFFVESNINSIVYLDMLQNFLFPQIEEIEEQMDAGRQIIFQQDGAPPHYALCVQEELNDRFPERWIGRNGPIPWPARSPDLTPLDFFLWGHVKNEVYSERIENLVQLKDRIRQAIESITPDVLVRVWSEIEYRFDVCRAVNGAHIETF